MKLFILRRERREGRRRLGWRLYTRVGSERA
jgi:hypothetical protein